MSPNSQRKIGDWNGCEGMYKEVEKLDEEGIKKKKK